MPCYASYLRDLFAEPELQDGTFTAVGAVHRPGQDDKIPRFVAHYWPDYDHELAASEPRPGTFLQYLAIGKKLARASGEAHPMVEKIAEGLLRLSGILNPIADIATRKRKHRYVRELLSHNPELERSYLEIVSSLITDKIDTVLGDWNQTWAPRIIAIASAVAGTTENSPAATAFLVLPSAGTPQPGSSQRDNVFRFPPETAKVKIRVGSIHSVKGETHAATLVLDTFFYSHHLATLKPWLVGEKAGGAVEKPAERLPVKAALRRHDPPQPSAMSHDAGGLSVERRRAGAQESWLARSARHSQWACLALRRVGEELVKASRETHAGFASDVLLLQ